MIEDTIGIIYIVSVVYLLIVGITGTFLNSTALIKAMKVNIQKMQSLTNQGIICEKIHYIGTNLMYLLFNERHQKPGKIWL